MGQEWDYVIESASDVALVPEILQFFSDNESPGIRAVDFDEVRQLVEDGLFFIARHGEDGPIVGTVYFSEQSSGSRVEYEIGGGLVALAHRRTGLVKCMAVCALVAFRMGLRRSSSDPGTDVAIVGRVEKSNAAPVRPLLTGIGFRSTGESFVDPATKPGLEKMPTDSGGFVIIDEFVFEEENLLQRVREAIAYRDTSELGKDNKTVRIAIRTLTAASDGDALKKFLSDLGG